jgi:Fe-S cluster biogenesis protein NfuA
MSDATPRRRIRAQGSARDPDVMGFVLDAAVQDGRSARFDGPEGAPLARGLFAIGGVSRVEVAEATIWVRKDGAADWSAMKPAIATAIRAILDATDAPLGAAEPDEADPEARLLGAVEDLLERQVNPAVAAHGRHIAAERVEGSTVYLRMSGGCQGCAASAATLREGVERMLRAALPQIGEIVDLTDHEAGSNPYYARERGASPVLNRPVPRGVIGWEDGQVMIDPEYLAPKLGLTPETLREGMRSGAVVGVTETEDGPGGGKTRVVMRSPGRAWAAELDAEGAAREIPPPRGMRA